MEWYRIVHILFAVFAEVVLLFLMSTAVLTTARTIYRDAEFRVGPSVPLCIGCVLLLIAWIWSLAIFCCQCCTFYLGLSLFTAAAFVLWCTGVVVYTVLSHKNLLDPCNADDNNMCVAEFGFSFILACAVILVLLALLVMAVFVSVARNKYAKTLVQPL